MLNLNDIYYFVCVVDNGGFSAAARILGLQKSTLSIRVTHLEQSLNVRLLQRTSRHLAMTDAGRDFYQHAIAMVHEAEAAEHLVRRLATTPSGTIRLTLGTATSYSPLNGLIAKFMLEYPEVNIVEHISDDFIDIVSDRYDLAVWGHTENLQDSTLIQRTLGEVVWCLFASEEYLATVPPILTPDDLVGCATLLLERPHKSPAWQLKKPEEAFELVVPLSPRLHTQSMATLLQATLAGLGIASLPAYILHGDPYSTLRRVLPEWITDRAAMTVVMPSRNGQVASIRMFLDFLSRELPPFLIDQT